MPLLHRLDGSLVWSRLELLMTGSFLLVPHIQNLLAWYGLWLILITGEISNFLEFYTFVGCVVLLFNPILMVNVEVLWMFSQPPQMIILIFGLD